MQSNLGPCWPDVYLLGTWLVFTLLFASLRRGQRNTPALEMRVARLEDLSTRDALTGLFNGRYLELIALPEALRAHRRTAVLFADLDDFKALNALSHRDSGDRALCAAAEALAGACRRSTDRVFRLYSAGDEFLLLLPGAGIEVAYHVAQAALAALRREGLSASFGLAYTDHRRPTAQEDLLREANALMHHAKQAGKGLIAAMGTQGPVLLADDEQAHSAAGEVCHD